MIQEPQEPEIIEIPIVNSMIPIETNSLKNITRNNKNPSIQNNKNRTTLIQIPKQNSKPRIFLLTRPVKPQTVRIATQSVQHHQENPLQKTATNIGSLTQSKIIRIPFLPRSQVQTFSVKSNQANQVRKKDSIGVPIEVNLYPKQNHNTSQASQLEIPKQSSILAPREAVQYVITQQVNTNQLSHDSSETSNRKLQTQQSVKSAIPQRTVINNNHLNLSENKNKTIQTPLTLTSMAGIELTGADMSLSQADMSGAMPPTATVEEINVPVFIDEYLQQAAISTTSVSTTNNNIHYISNNNNNHDNNNNTNNNQSNGKGNEVNNGLDTFENFEFDIDLLTENNYKEDDVKEFQVLEQQQQEYLQHNQQQVQQLAEVDEDKNLIFNTTTPINSMNIEDFKKQQQIQKQQQQLQLQLMLEDLLFNNNNNNNNNNSNDNNNIVSNNCKSNNNNNINITNTTSNINNNNTNNMAYYIGLPKIDEDVDVDDIFKVGGFSQMSEGIPDYRDFMDCDSLNLSDNINIEEAVDFNNSADLTLKDCFTRPQSNQVMLSSFGYPQSQSSASQSISQEILEAEPTIPPERIHYDNSSEFNIAGAVSVQLTSCETNEDVFSSLCSEIFDGPSMAGKETKLVTSLKRNGGSQSSSTVEKKRLKLSLDTTCCMEVDLQQKFEISTPNIIKSILQNDKSLDIMSPTDNSIDTIYHELISTSPSPQSTSVKSEIFADDVTTDFSPPNTPFSVNSVSNQTNFTGFMNTAPNSPASSIATTTNTSLTNKRGRGRPAKLHSDMPDISQLQHLSETDQKKILERIKNNEASRKSRLKHKEREIDLEKEQKSLSLKKAQLEAELKFQKHKEMKLQKALKAQHFQ